MQDVYLWMLIFAGAAIGLLGLFLAASERELKKSRRKIVAVVAQLEAGPKLITLDNPVESPSSDAPAPADGTMMQGNGLDEGARQSDNAATAEATTAEFRPETNGRRSSQPEILALRASNEQLQQEVETLKDRLQSSESRHGAAMAQDQSAAAERAQLQSEIAQLRSQLQTSRWQAEASSAASQRLAELESREAAFHERQTDAEAQLSALRQELIAASAQAQEFHASHERIAELERLYQEVKDENRELEAERSRWQERIATDDDQRRRSAVLRQRLDELEGQHAALIERHRQLHNELAAAARLLEIPLDGGAEAPLPPQSSLAAELRQFPTAALDGAFDAARSDDGENDEMHLDSRSSAASAGIGPMIAEANPAGAMTAQKRKRRFGIFPAMLALAIAQFAARVC